MVLGLDMRFLGRNWQKKNAGECNGNKISGLAVASVGACLGEGDSSFLQVGIQ